MPGMQAVIFRETIIAVTILAPRPKASRNVRERCSIEQGDEKSVQARQNSNRYSELPLSIEFWWAASRLDVPFRTPKTSKARLGHALFKQGN
jgi:hypothetical protein